MYLQCSREARQGPIEGRAALTLDIDVDVESDLKDDDGSRREAAERSRTSAD